jgi:hypothetical protein
MKLFTLRIEVADGDTADDVSTKLERIARALRKQSAYPTFLEDANECAGTLNMKAVTLESVHGTWSIEP